jgi:hypothetical protein
MSTAVWPSVDCPDWASLSLTDAGGCLRIGVTYGLGSGSPTVIALALHARAVHELAFLANAVLAVLDTDGDPSVDAFRAARGTVRVADGFVSVRARRLHLSGPPEALAAEVVVHNDQVGNYAVCFRQAEWAQITDALAEHKETP